MIQQQLAEAGIALEVRSYEFATLMADVIRGNVQLYTLQSRAASPIPTCCGASFHSAQMPPSGFNRGALRQSRVDRLIDAATAALDEDERRRLYGEAQRLIAADAPYQSVGADERRGRAADV